MIRLVLLTLVVILGIQFYTSFAQAAERFGVCLSSYVVRKLEDPSYSCRFEMRFEMPSRYRSW